MSKPDTAVLTRPTLKPLMPMQVFGAKLASYDLPLTITQTRPGGVIVIGGPARMSNANQIRVLQDTNASLEGVDKAEGKFIEEAIEQIDSDTKSNSDFTACREHPFYKAIVNVWGKRAIDKLISLLPAYPWIAIQMLQDITGLEPYGDCKGNSLEELIGAWKRWRAARRLPQRR